MDRTISRRSALGVLGALSVLRSARRDALAQGDEVVRVGMTSAFSGPAQALGTGMRDGMLAQLEIINARGGVRGRRIELAHLDDGYEPARAARNMRALIDERRVFAVLGNAGTPTAAVTVPIANEKRVPLFGAFTGAALLRRTPPDRYVINYRASYAQETAAMVRGLVTDLGVAPEHIGFFTQNDAYGDSGYHGAVTALEALGYRDARLLPHGRYSRNTLHVENALARLIDPCVDVRAVIMVGAYAPCARFIQLARRYGLRAHFLNVSFVGSEALAAALGRDGESVVVTQVVPHPDASLPACETYRAAVPPAARTFTSFEGFLVMRAFAAGLEAAPPGATSEQWIDTLEQGAALDLGLGVTHRLSPARHQLSDAVWPTVLRDGRFQPLLRWTDLGASR